MCVCVCLLLCADICPRHSYTKTVSRWRAYSCGTTRLAGSFNGNSHSHTFTADECGGQLPSGFCIASLRGGSHSGADEDYAAHANPAKVTWYCANCGKNHATVYADYLVRLQHCFFYYLFFFFLIFTWGIGYRDVHFSTTTKTNSFFLPPVLFMQIVNLRLHEPFLLVSNCTPRVQYNLCCCVSSVTKAKKSSRHQSLIRSRRSLSSFVSVITPHQPV